MSQFLEAMAAVTLMGHPQRNRTLRYKVGLACSLRTNLIVSLLHYGLLRKVLHVSCLLNKEDMYHNPASLFPRNLAEQVDVKVAQ
jgi:hypothetical protein